MTISEILSCMESVASSHAFQSFISLTETFGPSVLAFVGGLFGAKYGLDAFRKTQAYAEMELREARAWMERQKVGIVEDDKQVLKDHFNKLTRGFYAAVTSQGKQGEVKAREASSPQGRMAEIISNIHLSSNLQSKWNDFDTAAQGIFALIAKRDKGELNANSNCFPRAFSDLRAAWLVFFLSASPQPYDRHELVKLLSMGMVKRDFDDGGTEGDERRNPHHEDGTKQSHIPAALRRLKHASH